MHKIFTLFTVLVAFGLIFGGVFLASGGVSSLDVSEDSVETLEPVVRYVHNSCQHTPGYPDDCH